jgi:hypothetical protein
MIKHFLRIGRKLIQNRRKSSLSFQKQEGVPSPNPASPRPRRPCIYSSFYAYLSTSQSRAYVTYKNRTSITLINVFIKNQQDCTFIVNSTEINARNCFQDFFPVAENKYFEIILLHSQH